MPDQELVAAMEEKAQPKLPWHPPLLEKAEVNHDTASTSGSGMDAVGRTAV